MAIRIINDARAIRGSLSMASEYSSFQVMDHFRKWAQKEGMSHSECESHINTNRGKGLDHLKAALAVVQKFH